MVSSVLKAERRVGIQSGHFITHGCADDFVAARALFGSDEMVASSTAERTAVGMKAYNIEAANQAYILFVFHSFFI